MGRKRAVPRPFASEAATAAAATAPPVEAAGGAGVGSDDYGDEEEFDEEEGECFEEDLEMDEDGGGWGGWN